MRVGAQIPARYSRNALLNFRILGLPRQGFLLFQNGDGLSSLPWFCPRRSILKQTSRAVVRDAEVPQQQRLPGILGLSFPRKKGGGVLAVWTAACTKRSERPCSIPDGRIICPRPPQRGVICCIPHWMSSQHLVPSYSRHRAWGLDIGGACRRIGGQQNMVHPFSVEKIA